MLSCKVNLFLLRALVAFVCMALNGCTSEERRVQNPQGFYIPADLSFYQPEGSQGEVSLNGAVVFIDTSGRFEWFKGYLYRRGPDDTTMWFGADGGILYQGTWQCNGSIVIVEYRLMARVVPLVGEVLPGSIRTDTLQLRFTPQATLLGLEQGYVRTDLLTAESKARFFP